MNSNFEINEDLQKMIMECADPHKAEEVMKELAESCQERKLIFTDYQWKSLVNHICAMIMRSISGETIDLDISLFDEVSEDSLNLSMDVVKAIGGRLADDEMYLLSIHFESVKENN